MKKINAIQLRQSLTKIMNMLEKNKAPILIQKGQRAIAVLISIEDFKQRFVEQDADRARLEILEEIKGMAITAKDKTPSEIAVHELRYGKGT